MAAAEEALRMELAAEASRLHREGLVWGASGNISARPPGEDWCLIKPSGKRLGELKPRDFVKLRVSTGEPFEEGLRPSIETPLHTRLYSTRPKLGAIVHLHSFNSTLLSILGAPLQVLSVEALEAPALALGVPLAEYAPPGSLELAENVSQVITGRMACLLAYHGSVTLGRTIREAATNAIVLERLASLQVAALGAGVKPQTPWRLRDLLLEEVEKRGSLV